MQQQPLPRELLTLGDTIAKLPGVAGAMPHTTSSGGWGLTVQLDPGADANIGRHVEQISGQFPVLYETEARPPLARPAYPQLGE